MKDYIKKPIIELKEGDFVDLQGDKFADPNKNDYLEYQFIQVTSIEQETTDCVVVSFEGYDSVGFPPHHLVKVKKGE